MQVRNELGQMLSLLLAHGRAQIPLSPATFVFSSRGTHDACLPLAFFRVAQGWMETWVIRCSITLSRAQKVHIDTETITGEGSGCRHGCRLFDRCGCWRLLVHPCAA